MELGAQDYADKKKDITQFLYQDVHIPPTAQQATANGFVERIEAFKAVFGQHMRANHKDTISIAEVEDVVNLGADARYSRVEIMSILEVMFRCGCLR